MNAKRNKPRPLIWGLLILILLLPLAAILIKRMEGETPQVALKMTSPFLGENQTLSLEVSDKKTGIKEVWVALFKDGKETVLVEKVFPGANLLTGGVIRSETLEIPVNPKVRGIKDGKAVLRLVVKDYSWRKWGAGNRQYQEHEVMIDTRPPDISIVSPTLNIAQGGSGLVVYSLSEDCPESGVAVGKNYYPGHGGYFKDPLTRMAFIALDYRQGTDTPVAITATDFAGNQARSGISRHINRRKFRQDTINISDKFLAWKMPEFRSMVQADSTASHKDVFLRVNRDLRKQNYEKLVEITARTDSELHWQGAFSRLPGAANRAGYADHRKYIYKGSVIDRQTHMGIDLASLKLSKVPAANSGRVAFADILGIYGRWVMIDHGFGLFSMYSHLSAIDVAVDQMVAGGDILGKTGTTGMAGGDHLHFGMMIHSTFVNPREWWDAQWVKNNIQVKLDVVQKQ